ncbi:hypothetical protein HJC23_000724 [Cyclotella cryptica]|uniref:Uncharacterized protein n=1 Tax=Cyclotella cryptica TaxID=29204 RepID=A0ABD3QBY1_9STRA|eukprot:CCRYP_007417-RA/>CCRYP_007417-RA protein AED:0.25 eAED:0.25 QI:0/-1/0/1/-1/1/1/0/229
MRVPKAAFATFMALLLHASAAQLMRSTGLRRDQRRRDLNEDAEFGIALSMSVPDEDITFETSISLPLSMSVPAVIRPLGAKAGKDAIVGRPLVEFTAGSFTETSSEFETELTPSQFTLASSELTPETEVSVSTEVNAVTEVSTAFESIEVNASEIDSVAPVQTVTPAPTIVADGTDSKAAKESFVKVDKVSTDSASFAGDNLIEIDSAQPVVPTPPADPGFSGKSGKMP